jgi:hypothetical protein
LPEAGKSCRRGPNEPRRRCRGSSRSAPSSGNRRRLPVGAWKGQQHFSKPLDNFLASLGTLSKPIISVAFGDPYVLAKLQTTDVVLTPYNGTVLAERSIGKALVGSIEIKEKLPVTIPGKYRLDSGLELHPRSQRSK